MTLRNLRRSSSSSSRPRVELDPNNPPLLISYLKAAELLGNVSTGHVTRLVARGELRAVGQNRARRILYQSVLDYVSREAYGDA